MFSGTELAQSESEPGCGVHSTPAGLGVIGDSGVYLRMALSSQEVSNLECFSLIPNSPLAEGFLWDQQLHTTCLPCAALKTSPQAIPMVNIKEIQG